MSIDLNWEAITGGPEGDALALSIRDFIHEKFQTVPLPRFLKSVKVHSFSFGEIAPDIELKDITDPLPDFYEENPDADDADSGEDEEDLVRDLELERRRRTIGGRDAEERFRDGLSVNDSQFWRAQTPAGIPGGTSNLHYFQQTHLGAGWSGAQTPLAAVAGAQLAVPWSPGGSVAAAAAAAAADHAKKLGKPPKWPLGGGATNTTAAAATNVPTITTTAATGRGGHSRNASVGSVASEDAGLADLRERKADDGTAVLDDLDAALSAAGDDDHEDPDADADAAGNDDQDADAHDDADAHSHASSDSMPRFRAPRPDDVQVVFRIRYAGDIKLLLTAEILLDYPMPSFVGIPVKLNVTGLTFDGVGVLAHIRKRVHFCFLSPEDALAAVGPDGAELKEAVEAAAAAAAAAGGTTPGRTTPGTGPAAGRAKKFGGLLQEIRVESEIGQRESGKQSLKNVGKVERFILEQVRRIFEDEFVYPSFWTFLV